MPEHGFEIEPDLLGVLVGGFKHGLGYEQDFRARIGTDDRTFRPIAEAVERASDRIMYLTEFGREMGSEDDQEEAYELGLHTPNYASGPLFIDGDVSLSTDWKGEMSQESADACLAVLVQELRAAGLEDAKITTPEYRDSPRPFSRDSSQRSCIDVGRGRLLGRAVTMPDHPFVVASELFSGPVESRYNHQSCFGFRVEVDDRYLRSVALALGRAAGRLGWVTEFGRELGPDEVDEADSIELFAPNFGGVPKLIDGGIELDGTSTPKPPAEFSQACVAVVVQELLALNVPAARVGRTQSEQRRQARE